MSVQAVQWARRTRGHRSQGQKLVLMLLAENADSVGRAWPSTVTLAEDAEMSIRSVINALNDLERRMCLISREAHGNQFSAHKANVYQLHKQVQPVSLPPATARNTHPLPTAEEVKREEVQPQTEEVQSTTGASATSGIAIKEGTVIEPSIEPSYSSPPRKTPRPSWEAPEWFKPLTVLEGYTKQNHSKSTESVYTYCVEVADVDPAELVNRFCNDWPWLRVKFGRKDPVAMLRNTVELQASKLIREGHGQPERQTSGRADGWNIPSDGRQPEGHQGRETSGRAAGWDNQPDRA